MEALCTSSSICHTILRVSAASVDVAVAVVADADAAADAAGLSSTPSHS